MKSFDIKSIYSDIQSILFGRLISILRFVNIFNRRIFHHKIMKNDSRILLYASLAAVLTLILPMSYGQLQTMNVSNKPAATDNSSTDINDETSYTDTVADQSSIISHIHDSADNTNLSTDSHAIADPFQIPHYRILPEALAQSVPVSKKFTLIASSDTGKMMLPTGDKIALMTFNGTYPAPTIRVTQGDVVQITLINKDSVQHSVDFHGSQLSVVPNFGAVSAGQSKTFTFVAINPGAWAYHCEGNNAFRLWEHPMKGMVGMLIVDPKNGYKSFSTNSITPFNQTTNYFYTGKVVSPLAREFSMVFGEDYIANGVVMHSGVSVHDFDQLKMFNEIPTYTHVNGIPFGYSAPLLTLSPWSTSKLGDVMNNANLLSGNPNPALSSLTAPNSAGFTNATHIHAKAGEHVRFFLLNAGEKSLAFHIVGEQLDQVTVGNTTVAKDVDTWLIPAYGSAIVDVLFEQEGSYIGVNHDYSMLFKGQLFFIEVHSSSSTVPSNPSNAIAPRSALSSTSVVQTSCLYGIGPNAKYDNNTGDDNSFMTKCVA
jgi:nitrite reductase (NO-forming)